MSLIQCKCPNCGGIVKVNTENKTGYCNNCDSEFLLEENVINYSNVYHIENANIIVNQDSDFSSLLNSVKMILDSGLYEVATEISKKMKEKYPENALGYLYYVKAVSNNFTKDVVDGIDKDELGDIYGNFIGEGASDLEVSIFKALEAVQVLLTNNNERDMFNECLSYFYRMHATQALKRKITEHTKNVKGYQQIIDSLGINYRGEKASKLASYLLSSVVFGSFLLVAVALFVVYLQHKEYPGYLLLSGISLVLSLAGLIPLVVLMIKKHINKKRYNKEVSMVEDQIESSRNMLLDFFKEHNINENIIALICANL